MCFIYFDTCVQQPFFDLEGIPGAAVWTGRMFFIVIKWVGWSVVQNAGISACDAELAPSLRVFHNTRQSVGNRHSSTASLLVFLCCFLFPSAWDADRSNDKWRPCRSRLFLGMRVPGLLAKTKVYSATCCGQRQTKA